MRKVIIWTLLICSVVTALADNIYITGRVKSAVSKMDLTDAYVLLYDSAGNVSDTVRANKGYRYDRTGIIDTLAEFYFQIPRADTTLLFDVKCEGFKTLTMTFPVENIKKRENYREIPTIFLDRAPVTLNEVTVTTTKIKFYNKGDTLVYNADAFNLAEGSMLDALITQLPGAELSSDGQIKVNGEFVESLLLNGKEFMDGNKNIMLENIGAYTVKDIQVYQSQKTDDKERNDIFAPKVLTMNVQLKKEYNMGWLLNAQAGYGTEDRYMSRLFASLFTATTTVSLVGSANNLNDNRTPGRNDTWTPEQMPSGRLKVYSGGLNYNYEKPDETLRSRGSVMFRHSNANNYTEVSRTNFLPGGETYDKSFNNADLSETMAELNHSISAKFKNDIRTGASVSGGYSNARNVNSSLSGTFDADQQDMTMTMLDAIYSDGSAETLESIINRSKTQSDGWQRRYSVSFSPYFGYTLPSKSDDIGASFNVSYSSTKDEVWRDYLINYGNDPVAADHRRQYIDNTPNHDLRLGGYLSYWSDLGNVYLGVMYKYNFEDEVKDSYMYALDRLEDMGVYGVVPAGYLASLDSRNSYKSHTFTNTHGIMPQFNYRLQKDNRYLMLRFNPTLDFEHRKLNYWRDNEDFRLSTQNTLFRVFSIWNSMIEAGFGKSERTRSWRHTLRYSYRIEPKLPDMVDMLDIVSDSDPLNIYVGNPDLKTQKRFNHLVRWSYSPASHTFNNIFYLGFIHTKDALVRGYTYNTSTGVRVNRMYNVSGDRRGAVTNELSWQFGKKKQFALSSTTDASIEHANDMIGVNLEAPQPYTIKHRVFTQKLRLQYNFLGQTLTMRCDYTNRHTTSDRTDFNNINANHINYGLSGVFSLPAGFGISTDFMCYTRTGYGVKSLDTTDPVWNARLTYTPVGHKRWTFMVDGFDLLHKLSNVSYAINASGRTVTYTNTLPRYVMFSVQYRLNIQPKKR